MEHSPMIQTFDRAKQRLADRQRRGWRAMQLLRSYPEPVGRAAWSPLSLYTQHVTFDVLLQTQSCDLDDSMHQHKDLLIAGRTCW